MSGEKGRAPEKGQLRPELEYLHLSHILHN